MAQSDCGYLERSWAKGQRPLLGRVVSGHWAGASRGWILDSLPDRWDAAHRGYDTELFVRPALAMAWTGCGAGLRSELSSFYLAWLARLRPLSALRAEGHRRASMRGVERLGGDAARVLPWVQRVAGEERVGECAICTAQFFHPAARLIHLIARTPPGQRTRRERRFVAAYLPLLVRDHLLRLGFEAAFADHEAPGLPGPAVPRWEALTAGAHPEGPRYRYAFSDRDLYLTATAAELLAAAAADPRLVPLGSDAPRLRRLVHAGIERIRAGAVRHPATRDAAGNVVGSLSYFDGDYDAHPDHAFAGYAGAAYPGPADSAPPVGGGWDVSHYARVPVALRSLWDARRALAGDTIALGDVAALLRHYAFVMFTGDTLRPAFWNYTDGRNGWYRVQPGGERGFGHPPVQYCDSHDDRRPCLVQGAIQGWGQLAFAEPAIGRVHAALLDLAATQDSARVAFRDRLYWANWWSLARRGPTGTEWYPRLLWAVEAEYRLGRAP